MKMYRSNPNDLSDMVAMWPYTGFTHAQEVVDAFFAAYPHAPEDEYLDSLVIGVAKRAGFEIERH